MNDEPTAVAGPTARGGGLAATRLARSAAADRRLAGLFAATAANGSGDFALVAVGGYGRAELSPRSDLDVVLVHRPGTPSALVQAVAEAIWYPLWDDGVALDHAVRDTDQMREAAATDLRAAAGMLDLRHLAGSDMLTHALRTATLTDWRTGARTRLPELRAAGAERAARAGELAHAGIPDLKESAGGLRDGVVLRSLVATWLVDVPHAEAEACRAALLDVRDALHEVSGRPGNRLAPELLPDLAELLGTTAPELGRHIRLLGRRIAHLLQLTWRRLDQQQPAPRRTRRPQLVRLGQGVARVGGEVVLAADARPATDPLLGLRVGALAAGHGLLVAPSTALRLARSAAPLPVPWPTEARRLFTALLSAGPALVPVWEELEQAGTVAGWLPEWAPIVCRPSEALIHRFTVDRHSLEACVEASARAHEVSRPDLLVVAALLHDLGKSRPGDHSEEGAALAREIAARMGFAAADVQTVSDLVALHLLLPATATQRDLDDPTTARGVADRLGDRGLLDLLAALTESDARAASAQAWSSYRAALVHRLVAQVRSHLGAGPVLDVAAPMVPVRSVAVAGHDVRVGETAPEAGGLLWVGGADRIGLMADVAGALAWGGLVIRGCRARVEEGRLTSQWDVATSEVDLESLAHRLRRVLDGSVDLGGRISLDHGAGRPRAHVTLLDTASEAATVLEVRTWDRRGLLWRIFSSLAGTGLDVRSAHADTLGVQAVDVVYLLGPDGGPLTAQAGAGLVSGVAQALSGEEPAVTVQHAG